MQQIINIWVIILLIFLTWWYTESVKVPPVHYMDIDKYLINPTGSFAGEALRAYKLLDRTIIIFLAMWMI